ncbi:hypothetical protein FPV67DRAFT_1569119 [Lyophyllum atratum]|nr:hypothetical protein FPV67DRAFT_1569119 [Lyophyllum atratum]
MDILKLSAALLEHTELQATFDYIAITVYFDLVRLLRPILLRLRPSYRPEAPATLPINVHDFFNLCLGMEDDVGKLAWHSFKEFVWELPPLTRAEDLAFRARHIQLFLDHGLSRGIGVYNLEPPTQVCIDPQCSQPLCSDENIRRDRDLVEPLSFPITIFTRDFGAVPSYATSRYCRRCNTRYYANFYVHSKATTRTYYRSTDIPFIQTSQHFYMAAELCELFSTMMVTSWTSATNCARIYNCGLSNESVKPSLPAIWPTSLKLDVEDIWNGFYVHALILQHQESSSTLEFAHDASSQAERLRPALQARNKKMAGPGQEAWNHACDLCCWVYTDENGVSYNVRSVISDGIEMGCPCCKTHDCPIPLPTVKHHYCVVHRHLSKKCAVTTCETPIEEGFRTCSHPDHRASETYNYQKGKAMFQLKQRLERLKVSQTHDSLSMGPEALTSRLTNKADASPATLLPELDDSDNENILEGLGTDEDEEIVTEGNGICDGKSQMGNSVRARFGRRRTHSEQLCVASCGVILGRATFYGSEAPNGVRTFWMKLFPTQASLPSVIWHDNNCRIVAMLKNDGDPYLRHYFDNCALPVDVFHFKSKHKVSDEDCGRNCNPYIWPELRTTDGKWRFNSSAAEQANAWFGGFQSMVREMQIDRYEFFLDEMVKRRNRILIAELRRKCKGPYSIPREHLLRPDVIL